MRKERQEESLSLGMQTLMAVCEAMSQAPLRAQTVTTLAAHPDIAAPSTLIYRVLKNMEAAGWAEAHDKGAWALSPGLVHIAERLRLAIAQAHGRYLGAAGERS